MSIFIDDRGILYYFGFVLNVLNTVTPLANTLNFRPLLEMALTEQF